MLIPSSRKSPCTNVSSLSRRVNANSQLSDSVKAIGLKLIKKGEC